MSQQYKHKYYRAVMRGRDDIQITPEQAETISLALLANTPGRVIQLKDSEITFRVGECRRIEPDLEREALERREQRAQVELVRTVDYSGCRGQFSIQKEINMVAFRCSNLQSDRNPDGVHWSKLVSDKDWRSMIRVQLRESGGFWCDFSAGECFCKPDFKPRYGRHYDGIGVTGIARPTSSMKSRARSHGGSH